MTEQQITYTMNQNQETVNALVDGLTLFDDDLMSRVFDKNIEATELVLRIILGRKIRVISVNGQDERKNPEVGGRNITLDVYAIDEDGEEIDIEVQVNSEGAHIRRARFHSSVIDSRMLKEGQEFKKLKDSYVIFIYKHDKFRKGFPLYHIDRYIKETGDVFGDGSHIIYVNGSYKGTDEIGQLIHDFHQTDPERMHYGALSKGVRHFKEIEKERDGMCDAVKEYAKEYAEEYVKGYQIYLVKNLMDSMNWSLDQALDALKIQGEQREFIEERLQNPEGNDETV